MNRPSSLGSPIPVVANEIQPVFLVGMNGSGTTMLLDSIGRHPDLYAYPRETKAIPSLIASVDKFGELSSDRNFLRLWRDVCTTYSFTLSNQGQPVPIPSNWDQFPRDLAAVLDALFRYFAAKEGKTRWCEKTPQHVQHLPQLHSLFPGARFVHVIRDGRDCTASIQRRYKRTPEYSIYRWKNVVRQGRDQGALLGDKYLEVRYEDITINPELWMKKICEFLGIPFHPNVLLSRRPRTENAGKPGEVMGGLEPNSGKWATHFSERQLARMETIAGACLAELNYSVKHHTGDANPPKVQLIYWQWKDFAREFLSVFSKFWVYQRKNRRKIKWSSILKRIRVALMQSRTNRY